jgi:cellulose synthase/poly-beta-1,6-N-acetylglucosamine synthase-like glycosyltransferase
VSIEVTVGICAHNEDMNIGKLLDNILNLQELPSKSEVLVVCSGCTDNTVSLVHEYSKKDSRVHAYVESERKGKASAVQYILLNARGKVIFFISADTLPTRKCFPRLLSKLQLPNVGVVCGHPVPINSSKSFVGKLVKLLWGFHDQAFQQLNDAGLARHATEIFCIRKGIVENIPIDTVNDDAYLALIAKKKGWLIKYDTEARVSICGPQTFTDYIKQRRRVLFGHYQVRRMTGESPQHLIFLLPLYPIRVMKLIFWFCKEHGLLAFLTFVVVELGINAAAALDSILGKSHTKWSISSSTKRITNP